MNLDVLLPDAHAAQQLGELPGVRGHVYDGRGEVPDEARNCTVWVPPFLATLDVDAVIAAMPRLEVVQLVSAGAEKFVDHIPEGVLLCTARGAHSGATAEWIVAAILASVRQFPRFLAAQALGKWDNPWNGELAGRRILVVGAGDIGRALGRRLEGFNVEVRYVARSAREGVAAVEDLPALLPEHEVVVLLVPTTPATIGMVDATFLAAMPDGALLVNAARGPVVDTDALLAELSSERLHAALDVTEPEPLPEGHPLWSAPNLLLTPHTAGSVPRAGDKALAVVRAQLERLLAGQPLCNVVSQDGY
ncbi:MAG: 2-hydroxyacid dehydrogenase [Actinomycetota bacterium]|nr:2-hydroxyacid dehydrogenase [Actinomycetota bacterium]